jgi:hypothetical protein
MMKKLRFLILFLFASIATLKAQNIALKGGFQVLAAVEGRSFSGVLLEVEAKQKKRRSFYSRVGYSAQSEGIISGIPVQYRLFNIGTGLRFHFREAFDGFYFKSGLFYATELVDYGVDNGSLIGIAPLPNVESLNYAGVDFGLGHTTVIDKLYFGFDLGLGINFFKTDNAIIGFSTQIGYRF